MRQNKPLAMRLKEVFGKSKAISLYRFRESWTSRPGVGTKNSSELAPEQFLIFPVMILAVAILLCTCTSVELMAEDASVEAVRHERMLQLAKSYTLSDADGSASAKLHDAPIFSWASPEREAHGGELYLWTLQGRPFATIGIWTYDDIKDSHELQSLSSRPLRAVGAEGFQWQPQHGGLDFKRLAGAPPPDRSGVRRQVQMRTFLRERFAAELIKADNQQVQLRLLSRPLYRYDPLPAQVIDGAMFAFALGTDPEVLVLLEAREEADAAAWYYAFAPATSGLVQGQLDGQQVWSSADQLANGTFLFFYNR